MVVHDTTTIGDAIAIVYDAFIAAICTRRRKCKVGLV